MKRTIMYFALAMGIVTANAQENKSVKESIESTSKCKIKNKL